MGQTDSAKHSLAMQEMCFVSIRKQNRLNVTKHI